VETGGNRAGGAPVFFCMLLCRRPVSNQSSSVVCDGSGAWPGDRAHITGDRLAVSSNQLKAPIGRNGAITAARHVVTLVSALAVVVPAASA
jgi:hypothetical protein